MTEVLKTAKLGLLMPALLNPVTLAAVGVGVGLMWLLRDEDEETIEEAPTKRLPRPSQAVAQPLLTVEVLQRDAEPMESEAAHLETAEVNQKEIIRSAMSGLGKRSATARAQKKAQTEVGETD
jgi:hypothetical protein